jgi:hypothetical protein
VLAVQPRRSRSYCTARRNAAPLMRAVLASILSMPQDDAFDRVIEQVMPLIYDHLREDALNAGHDIHARLERFVTHDQYQLRSHCSQWNTRSHQHDSTPSLQAGGRSSSADAHDGHFQSSIRSTSIIASLSSGLPSASDQSNRESPTYPT